MVALMCGRHTGHLCMVAILIIYAWRPYLSLCMVALMCGHHNGHYAWWPYRSLCMVAIMWWSYWSFCLVDIMCGAMQVKMHGGHTGNFFKGSILVIMGGGLTGRYAVVILVMMLVGPTGHNAWWPY